MTSLKAEPAGRIRSMIEFFAIARAMELDAATRYAEAAHQLREQGQTTLANVFDTLAETERGHVREVDQWADHEGARADASLPWPIPDTFDAPPQEMARSRLMTPYQALASAVRHEQRSFAFWTYVASHADTGEVKEAAERMALDELEHIALLRRERRKAFHIKRREGEPVGEHPATLATLADSERRLADLIEADPSCAHERAFALSLAASARESAAKLDALDATHRHMFTAPALPAGRDDAASLAEYLTEAYLRLAETAQDGTVLGLAQDLAKTAIYRLGTLNLKEQARPGQ